MLIEFFLKLTSLIHFYTEELVPVPPLFPPPPPLTDDITEELLVPPPPVLPPPPPGFIEERGNLGKKFGLIYTVHLIEYK